MATLEQTRMTMGQYPIPLSTDTDTPRVLTDGSTFAFTYNPGGVGSGLDHVQLHVKRSEMGKGQLVPQEAIFLGEVTSMELHYYLFADHDQSHVVLMKADGTLVQVDLQRHADNFQSKTTLYVQQGTNKVRLEMDSENTWLEVFRDAAPDYEVSANDALIFCMQGIVAKNQLIASFVAANS